VSVYQVVVDMKLQKNVEESSVFFCIKSQQYFGKLGWLIPDLRRVVSPTSRAALYGAAYGSTLLNTINKTTVAIKKNFKMNPVLSLPSGSPA
jgi:hypothetical protein